MNAPVPLPVASKLGAALDLARHGFPVFPIVPNGKKPLIANWQNLASCDLGTVAAAWNAAPDSNIGIATANYLVVDVDPRHGGDASLAALELTEDWPETVETITQSGGRHRIYRLTPGVTVANSKGKLGPGIDVKSYGGLIVAPGSTIEGRQYRWADGKSPRDRHTAMAPQWLIVRCKAPRPKSADAGKRIVEEDDAAQEAAFDYISRLAPEAEDGERNDTAYKVAAKLFDFGVTFETALELMQEYWNGFKCRPALDADELQTTVRSAMTNRSRAIGAASPNAPGFEAYEMPPTTGGPRRVTGLVRFGAGADLALVNAGEPLIADVVERGAMSVIYGESNSGKTFVALDTAFHIAAGMPWCGRRVHRGAVIYVAAEGGRGIYKRFAALRLRYPEAGDVPLYVYPAAVDLLRASDDAKRIVALSAEAEKESGRKVELIVVDTLSRVLSGGDENSSTDMGALVRALDQIRHGTGAHLSIIHHTGKDKARGARGHSLLRGATDTEIEIADHKITTTKQRDLDSGQQFHFTLRRAVIGKGADGRDVTSCTIDTRDSAASGFEHVPLQPELQDLLDDMKARVRDKCDISGGSACTNCW